MLPQGWFQDKLYRAKENKGRKTLHIRWFTDIFKVVKIQFDFFFFANTNKQTPPEDNCKNIWITWAVAQDFPFITLYLQPPGTAPLLFKCGSEYSFVFLLLSYLPAPLHLKGKLMETQLPFNWILAVKIRQVPRDGPMEPQVPGSQLQNSWMMLLSRRCVVGQILGLH